MHLENQSALGLGYLSVNAAKWYYLRSAIASRRLVDQCWRATTRCSRTLGAVDALSMIRMTELEVASLTYTMHRIRTEGFGVDAESAENAM